MAAAAPAPAPAEGEGQSLMDRLMPVVRMVFIWYAVQSGMRLLAPSPTAPSSTVAPPSPAGSPAPAPIVTGLEDPQLHRAAVATGPRLQNAFHVGEPLSLRVYVSPESHFTFAAPDELDAVADEQERLLWQMDDVVYKPASNPAREDGVWTHAANLSVDEHLLANGSVFAHIFLTKHGYSPNPEDETYERMASIYRTIELTAFRPRPKIVKKRNLLESKTQDDDDMEDATADVADDTYISMWKPAFSINVILDHTVYSSKQQPPPFVASDMDIDSESGKYLPVLFINDFWLLEDDLVPVNATISALPLEITYYPLPLWKYALYTQMDQNFRNQEATGTSTKRDTDGMKRLFIDTNPYLLGITMAVSLLHSLFDFLAFKNDVSFWKNQKSLAGLSLRTIVLNTFFQLVIFLYLMDNDTSWMILISSGISLVIEVWKIKKALVFSRDENNKLVVSGVESYEESPTAEHDRVAVAHLSYVLYPLIVGQAFYTLAYGQHKGWYSWVVSSLTSFVYAFGFIMMTPQLYINYKLKSVAHLPWRAMVYKSLNTFIDDLFAFVIKMPWMHRLSCFRDDLIFFIYLYQRWIYPVDAKRTNEFGQGPIEGDEGDKSEPEAIESAPEEDAAVDAGVDKELVAMLSATEDVAKEDVSTEYLMSKRANTLES